MNKLWVRLALAFGLVTFMAVMIAAFLANRQVSVQFERYLMHNQMMDSMLAPTLVEYYAAEGSWDGVETALENVRGSGMGRGLGQGEGMGMGQGGPAFSLADAAGQIIYDKTGVRPKVQLSRQEIDGAVPIQWQNETVGYLLVAPSPGQIGLSESAQAFLGQVNRSLLQAGFVAGVLGILLGILIARGVSAPLGRLATAARRMSTGDLSQRVPEKGTDEISDVAQAFNEMSINLEQAEILRRHLIADVAHELRTPVTVLQGNLRAILDDVYPLEKEEIASIYDETLILSRLITDLRELAQAEAGQLSLNIGPTDLSLLITSMTDLFRELAREQDIKLQVDIPDNLPSAQADTDRVRQVLHNYISNALRHTPNNGTITVSASTIGGTSPSRLRVTVADTGAGIPPNDLPHVFDRFWRADKARSREQGSSGLGLAIARQLIEAQDGQVGVESELGQGSRFWFTLPQS